MELYGRRIQKTRVDLVKHCPLPPAICSFSRHFLSITVCHRLTETSSPVPPRVYNPAMKTNMEQVIMVMGPRILVGGAQSHEYGGQEKMRKENGLSQSLSRSWPEKARRGKAQRVAGVACAKVLGHERLWSDQDKGRWPLEPQWRGGEKRTERQAQARFWRISWVKLWSLNGSLKAVGSHRRF